MDISKYTGCQDSEQIAKYIDKINYEPEKREEILRKFYHLLIRNKKSTSKVLVKKLRKTKEKDN